MRLAVDATDLKAIRRSIKRYPSVVTRATKRSMARTLPLMKRITVREIKTRYYAKAKPTSIKSRMRDIKRLSGSDLDGLAIGITFDKKPFSLIDFVKGAKTPRRQAGIPIAKRPKLKAEITKGKVTILAKSFIAKGKGGNFHVFRRDKAGKLIKRSEPQSLAYLLGTKAELHTRILRAAVTRFNREFSRTLTFLLGKA